MENGVLHNGLQNHFGNHAGFQLLRQADQKAELVGQPDFLYFHIPVQHLHLPAQRHKFLGRDTKPQNIRQIRGHQGHLGDMVNLTDPLHGVQGVAQEMGIQLSLQHPYLGLIQLPLIFHQLLPVGLQGQNHVIKACCQLTQLILSVPGDVDVQIVLLQPGEGLQQPPDGLGDPAAQRQAEHRGNHNAHQNTEKAGGVEQLHGALSKHLGLTQYQIQAGGRMLLN